MVEYLDSSSGHPEDALGSWLAEHLTAGVTSFRCQTGYFSLAALRDHLETLQGIETVRIVLGSNPPEQPTEEDVRALLPLLTDPARRSITIVACAGTALFHPKTIHIVGADGAVASYVGSANLTEAGLGFNVEAGVVLGPEDDPAPTAIADSIDDWARREEDGVYHIRGEDDVADLLEKGILTTSSDRRKARAASRKNTGTRRRGLGLRRTRHWKPTSAPKAVDGGEDDQHVVPEAGDPEEGGKQVGRRQWSKLLKRSDAQQTPDGTNPTGVLRLTKARFPIDHQTYFRNDFFKDETWARVDRGGKVYEECSVPFNVDIHGTDHGEHVLRVDHAAHRIAGQNNVPTVVGWGPELGRHLKENSEVDNWVVLTRHEDASYTLEITSDKPGWAP